MGQIIKSLLSVCLSVCPSVCHLSYGHNSHSILMKLYTIDRNAIDKNPFVGGQNPTIPSPIFPQFFYWMLLGSCYAPSDEKCYNPISI